MDNRWAHDGPPPRRCSERSRHRGGPPPPHPCRTKGKSCSWPSPVLSAFERHGQSSKNPSRCVVLETAQKVYAARQFWLILGPVRRQHRLAEMEALEIVDPEALE